MYGSCYGRFGMDHTFIQTGKTHVALALAVIIFILVDLPFLTWGYS